MHADHLSGASRLAKKYAADIYISSLEGYEIINRDGSEGSGLNITSIKDGDKIKIGNETVLEAIHTPSHTNGSISFKLQINENGKIRNKGDGLDRNKERNYLFTGDTLFIDGVGRPDLHNKAEEFTYNLYNSYHQKILNLPNGTLILSAHLSGSFTHEKPISNTINSIKQKMNLLSAS